MSRGCGLERRLDRASAGAAIRHRTADTGVSDKSLHIAPVPLARGIGIWLCLSYGKHPSDAVHQPKWASLHAGGFPNDRRSSQWLLIDECRAVVVLGGVAEST